MPSIVGTVTCEPGAGTANVNVVSLPQVALAGTPNVKVVSMPQVEIAGTPTVNVANFPSGGSGGGMTTLVHHEVKHVDAGQLYLMPNFDVSAYREVRVNVAGVGTADFQFYIYAVDESGVQRNLLLTDDIIQSEGGGSRLFTVPSQRITFLIVGPSVGQADVGIMIFGRA